MKRIVIALFACILLLSLFAACAPKFSPVKGGEVSVRPLNVEPAQDPVSLKKEDAEQLIAYLQNLPDGTNYLCKCLPDVSITIDGRAFSYHSDSGVLSETVGGTTNHYYVGKNREAINDILKQYITLGHH